MSTMRTTDLPWTMLAVDATGEKFIPATDFMDAGAFTMANGYGEARGVTGSNMVWALAVQTADDPRDPDTHTRVTTQTGSEGPFDPDSSNTSITTGKRYLRLGWAAGLTTGSGLATVMVRGRIRLLTD